MAKLFIGLAIVAMLAAAVLGFLAKDNIDKLQANLKERKQTIEQQKRTIAKTEADLKKSEEDLALANTKIEQQTGEIAMLTKDKAELAMKVTAAEMERDAKAKELADMIEKMPKGEPGKQGPDPAAIAVELEQKKADLAKAQSDLAEKTQVVNSLTQNKAAADEKLANATKEIERYRAGVTKAGLSGKILAVNPGWNFVVLSVGDRQGAATGGVMIVTRGGEAIGRVRITSIEPSTSIADIIPGSNRRGVTVQPGDTVVYEGPRTKPGPNALGAAAPGVAPLPAPAP